MAFATFVALVAAIGCERAHPAADDLQIALDALEFGDVDRLFELHVDSTNFSPWCEADFRNIIARAQKERDDAECARLGEISAADLDQMTDELRLAVQVAAFACEKPRGTCTDYAEKVFRQAAVGAKIDTDRPRSHNVRRLFGDDGKAAAYVELTFADGRTQQRILELRLVGNRWRVADGLFP